MINDIILLSPYYIKTGNNIRIIDLIDEYGNLINVYLVIEYVIIKIIMYII